MLAGNWHDARSCACSSCAITKIVLHSLKVVLEEAVISSHSPRTSAHPSQPGIEQVAQALQRKIRRRPEKRDSDRRLPASLVAVTPQVQPRRVHVPVATELSWRHVSDQIVFVHDAPQPALNVVLLHQLIHVLSGASAWCAKEHARNLRRLCIFFVLHFAAGAAEVLGKCQHACHSASRAKRMAAHKHSWRAACTALLHVIRVQNCVYSILHALVICQPAGEEAEMHMANVCYLTIGALGDSFGCHSIGAVAGCCQ